LAVQLDCARVGLVDEAETRGVVAAHRHHRPPTGCLPTASTWSLPTPPAPWTWPGSAGCPATRSWPLRWPAAR
jgi:hypothetical protein